MAKKLQTPKQALPSHVVFTFNRRGITYNGRNQPNYLQIPFYLAVKFNNVKHKKYLKIWAPV